MKIDRDKVFNKYGGLCAYSGTPLEKDWQIDHLFPKNWAHVLKSSRMISYYGLNFTDINDIKNLMPCQRIINHYKRSLSLEQFRELRIMELHNRLAKLPKNPKVEKSIKTKEYMIKAASYFGITVDKPFSGKFYFETI